MYYLLLIHVIIAIWVVLDGYTRKANGILWAIVTTILGPIILPQYMAKRPLKANETRGGRKSQNLFRGLALFWALMLAVIGIWGGKTSTNTIKKEPLEYRLAVINNRGYVRENDPIIDRFRSLLDQLSQSYIEDQQQIANMSVIIRDKMRANGTEESLLNIMEGLNQLLWPQDLKKRRYSEYALTYLGLRNKGLPHQDAIERLQALVSGY